MKKIVNNNDWRKNLKKLGYGIAYTLICGLIYILTDKVAFAFLVPAVLIPAQNFVKHKLGWKWL